MERTIGDGRGGICGGEYWVGCGDAVDEILEGGG